MGRGLKFGAAPCSLGSGDRAFFGLCFALFLCVVLALNGSLSGAAPPKLPDPPAYGNRVVPPDPFLAIPGAPRAETSRGWLPARFSCDQVVPPSPGTNEAFFFFVWRTNAAPVGDLLATIVCTVTPLTIPEGRAAALEWCNYPRGTWYRLECLTNGQAWRSTNWADMPIGFYRLRW